MMNSNVIEVNNVWVSYPENQRQLLKNLFKREKQVFWALKGLNFQVKKGEVLGIVGRNGSGKSTLLRLLSGLISPDKGEYIVRGKRPVLLSLGAGFDPELTGVENIYLNGLFLGYKKSEIAKILEAIISFSELGDFVNKPIRTYSSGMRARLAFSTAITMEPEILLIDEVLGVGDTSFQEKCKRAIMEKIQQNCTVIIVTHSANMVKNICDRVIWLHLGEQRQIGLTTEVVTKYQEFMKH